MKKSPSCAEDVEGNLKDKLSGFYKDLGAFKDWKALKSSFDENCKNNLKHRWIFRGQPEGDLGLTTVLDRLFKMKRDPEKIDKKSLELGLLRKFMRQYEQFEEEVIPEEEDIPGWLSLMRHYGAPTRLLDWTWSFNIATFFAVEKIEAEDEKPCEVWAVDLAWLEDERLFSQDLFSSKKMENIFRKKDRNLREISNFKQFLTKPAILPITPYYLNKRLAIQQGVFLMSCDVAKDFSENLIAHAGRRKDKLRENLVKFKIDNTINTKTKIMQHLHGMNMSRTVLYPGLDGFAKSLGNYLFLMPGILEPGNLYNELYPRKKNRN